MEEFSRESQREFKAYMEEFQANAEDYYLGGEVTAIAKYSREIQKNQCSRTGKQAGLNLVTYFGHSSTTTTDFEIGDVTNPVHGYNNKGKYPVFLMNGCNAGFIFLTKTYDGGRLGVRERQGSSRFYWA